MAHDYYSLKLPQCPPTLPSWLVTYIQAPSTSVILLLLSLLTLFLALLVLLLYNAVSLPKLTGIFRKRKIRTPLVRNHWWAVYFLCASVSYLCNVLRFGWNVDSWSGDGRFTFLFICTVVSMVLHTVTCMFLTLALAYQKRYRSGDDLVVHERTVRAIEAVIAGGGGGDSKGNQKSGRKGRVGIGFHDRLVKSGNVALSSSDGDDESVAHVISKGGEEKRMTKTGEEEWFNDMERSALISNSARDASSIQSPDMLSNKRTGQSSVIFSFYTTVKRWILSIEMGAIALLAVNCIAIAMRAANPWDRPDIYKWVQLACVILQQFWVIVACVFIAFGSTHTGAKTRSRTVLMAALCIGFSNEIPISFLHMYFSRFEMFQTCTFWFMSIYDLLLLLQFASSILWMWFVRAEFWRNQAEVFHQVISHTQGIMGKYVPIF